jgi:putative transposase
VLDAAIGTAETLLGTPLKDDLVDRDTGEIVPLVVVTDNGPAFKSMRFQLFFASRPELRHVRTRHHAPETNGVVERFFGSIKYEHLYREEIAGGQELHEHAQAFVRLYNDVRPHERLGFGTPREAYLRRPESHLFQPESVQET